MDLWNPPPGRIAVFRAHMPHARTTLVGLPWAQSFVDRFHAYVDDHLP